MLRERLVVLGDLLGAVEVKWDTPSKRERHPGRFAVTGFVERFCDRPPLEAPVVPQFEGIARP
jgi:hypothetical protein